MTLRFRFLNESKEWVVVGPAHQLRVGPVTVTKMNGEPKTETITRLSKPYTVDGEEFRFGYLRPLPKLAGVARRLQAPLPDDTRKPAKPQSQAPDLSDAVLDLAERNNALMKQNALLNSQLVRLLNYVMNMREDYTDVDWPQLPDTYSPELWRAAS